MNGSHHSSNVGCSTVTEIAPSTTSRNPACLEQLCQVALACAGELGFVVDIRVELARGVPEETQRPLATGVIPHARRYHAAGACNARHLPQPCDRVGHEVDDELRKRGFELTVPERQLLGRGTSNVDSGMALSRRRDERLRRVDRRHLARSDARGELGGKGARPTADVQHALPGFDPCDVGELRAQAAPSNVP